MTAGQADQLDPARRRRLRWRARRGLLENDLVLARFFDRYELSMSDRQVVGLDQLLDLEDNDLMDLILDRTQPDPAKTSVEARDVLELLRRV
jgi:antitoxin CptB